MNKQQIDYTQKGFTKPKEHYIYRVKFLLKFFLPFNIELLTV